MNINIKRKFKQIDLSIAFLVLFIFILSLFIYNLNQINSKTKIFNYYSTNIANTKILDSEFNLLIYNNVSFINNDEIVKKINQKYELLKILNTESFYKEFNPELKFIIDDLNKKWYEKHLLLEQFKSNNSMIVGSLNHITELIKNIRLNQNINDSKDNLLIDFSLATLFKFSINIETEKNTYEKNLKNLNFLAQKYRSLDFELFYKEYDSTINNFMKINMMKEDYLKINTRNLLNLLENKIYEEYNKSIFIQERIAILLFIISVIFLIISILSYIKSVHLKNQLKAFRYAVENSDNSIVITDKNKKIIYVNESFEKTTGYKREDALGKNPNILKSGKLPNEFYKQMNEILNKGEKWFGKFINVNKSGDIFYETASITPIIEDHELTGYLAIKLNVTEYVKQQEEVEFIAYHDNLTLLPNRRSLEKKINEFLAITSTNRNKKFALLFIDLDGFKIVNDTLGHNIGDLLLKEISRIFLETLRDTDYIFRIGGDEFSVILDFLNKADIEIVAKKIIENINKPIKIMNNILHVGCSIGISIFPQDAQDLQNLLKYSDIAMYKAKENGKNRFIFYNSISTYQ